MLLTRNEQLFLTLRFCIEKIKISHLLIQVHSEKMSHTEFLSETIHPKVYEMYNVVYAIHSQL